VVSGHIRGQTTPCRCNVEILYNEYNFVAVRRGLALSLLALATLVLKRVLRRAPYAGRPPDPSDHA